MHVKQLKELSVPEMFRIRFIAADMYALFYVQVIKSLVLDIIIDKPALYLPQYLNYRVSSSSHARDY